jgi:hypothetical protein
VFSFGAVVVSLLMHSITLEAGASPALTGETQPARS